MKKLLIPAIALAIALPGASAQDSRNKNVLVSANAAIGGAGCNGSDVEWNNAIFAYRLGVGLDFPISRRWGFRTGVNFERLGITGNSKESHPDLNREHGSYAYGSLSSLYLEVPLMATVRFDAGRRLDIVLYLGPYIGAGVGGKISIEGEIEHEYFSWAENLYAEGSTFRRFDMGVGFGVGFELKRVVFSIDHHIGFLRVRKRSDIYNNAVFCGVGYKF